jgi:hypothetical protein
MNDAMAGMIFTLLFTVVIGGVILLYPITRRLGAFLEAKLEDRHTPDTRLANEVAALGEAVRGMESELRAIAEKQEFTERLLLGQRQAPAARDELPG